MSYTVGSLQEFLYTASRLRLPMQPVETSNPLLFGMTLKKSHEVSRVSEFITKITASSGVEQVSRYMVSTLIYGCALR